MGLAVAPPIDIEYDARYDLLQSKNRDMLWDTIEDEDPFLLSLSPLCGPWSPWQRLNMTRSEETYDKVMYDWKQWYPVLAWVMKVVERRLSLGREVLLENPWPSLLWQLKCYEKTMENQPRNMSTGEPLGLVKLDQCMYGLANQEGVPHEKSTGMLLSSSKMKSRLQQLCDGSHLHDPLEGNKTKKAQQWREKLCREIIAGALDELKSQIMMQAFPAEYQMESQQEEGMLDGICGTDDVANQPSRSGHGGGL